MFELRGIVSLYDLLVTTLDSLQALLKSVQDAGPVLPGLLKALQEASDTRFRHTVQGAETVPQSGYKTASEFIN